jgi:hypothetical protein
VHTIQRSFPRSSARLGLISLISLLVACNCSLPVLAQSPAAPPAAPSATQPPVAGADASIPSPQLMSLNTFNTFDVSDVPPAPPAADGMVQPPSSNVAPSSDLEAQCREQIKELKRRMEALERLLPQRPGSAAAAVTPTPPQPPKRVTFGQTQIGKYTPLRSLNRPMPFGAAPPPEPASPAATAAAPPLPAMAPQAAPSAPIAVPEPSFITINDVSIGARATPVIDTTRLDPAAQGLFLPSASAPPFRDKEAPRV